MNEVERKIRAHKYLYKNYMETLRKLKAALPDEMDTVQHAMENNLRFDQRHAILDAAEEILRVKQLLWAAENLDYLARNS